MARNKMKILFIAITLALIFFFVQKYILGGSFIWKTYKNPNVSFTFKYPSNWYLCEELYPNLEQNYIHVSDQLMDCEHLNQNYNSRFLSIGSSNETTTETDIKVYLEKMEQEDKKEKEKGGLPRTPGFTWYFQDHRNDLLALRGSSTAKVSGIYEGQLEYISLYNNRIYSFDLSQIDTLKSLPIRFILWTFRVNN